MNNEATPKITEGGIRWYAVQVRANQEKTTASFLANRSVSHFLPTYKVISKRADRRVTLNRPLFTGYVFIQVDYSKPERVEAIRAPGAVRVVGFGNTPTPIDDEVIETLQILTRDADNEVRPHPLVRIGNRVRITDGPFAGAKGILKTTKGRTSHLVVEIEFLGRAVSVPISIEQTTVEFE